MTAFAKGKQNLFVEVNSQTENKGVSSSGRSKN
jgi:hypothetical protein